MLRRRRKQMRTRRSFLRAHQLEQLEDRRLLAVTTPTLGTSTDLVFNSDGDVDVLTFSVGSTGLLQHNNAGGYFNSSVDLDASVPGDQTREVNAITSLTYTDAGANDAITFEGVNPFSFGSADVSVMAGTITVNTNASIASTDGALAFYAGQSISLKSGSSLTTVDGGITLEANVSGTSPGVSNGINAVSATLESSGTGDLLLVGVGGLDGGAGVNFDGDIRSTSTDVDAGTITIDGVGGAATNSLRIGVALTGSVTSAIGDILVTGTGGASTLNSSYGIYTRAVFTSTGTDANAATITLNGYGGGVGSSNFNAGVRVDQNSDFTSGYGNITITGQGGLVGRGVDLFGFRQIASTGIGESAARVTIDGSGGISSNFGSMYGVYLESNGVITSVDGAIAINGRGGISDTGDQNHGVYSVRGSVSSTGVGPYAASIDINGSGGSGDDEHVGVRLGILSSQIPTVVTSVDGPITISGHGGSGLDDRHRGIELFQGVRISSSGFGPDAATITIDGEGGTGDGSFFNNAGVYADRSEVTSVSGTIHVSGRGGVGGGRAGNGVELSGSILSSTGVGADAATIHIEGTGGQGNSGHGVSLATTATSIDGDITVLGLAGVGSSAGILMEGGTIASTGTGTDAARITMVGEGSIGSFSRGVHMQGNSSLTSVDGDIAITGRGGGGTSGSNYGLYLPRYSISSTGIGPNAARITLDGTGGSVSGTTHGIYLAGVGTLTSVDGDVRLTGQAGNANSSGIWVENGAVISSTGIGPNAARINFEGTGPLSIVGTNTEISSVDGDILIAADENNRVSIASPILSKGTGLDAATVTVVGRAVSNSGSIASIDGAILLVGTEEGVSMRGPISSTGNGPDAATITINGVVGDGVNGNHGVDVSGSITSIDGDVSISGTGGLRNGVQILSDLTVENASVAISGTSYAVNAYGVQVSSLGSITTGSGSLYLDGDGNGPERDLFIASVVGGPNAIGDIVINADSADFRSTASIQSSGAVAFRPRTPTTTIGLGGGSGELNLADDELTTLVDGFSSITIGDVAGGTGTVDIDTAVFVDPITIAGGTFNDHSGSDIDAGVNPVTLIGSLAPGQSPGILVVTGELTLTEGDGLALEIGGANPGELPSDHDQVDVTGSITIGPNVTLDVSSFGGYTPLPDQQFVIVNNDGSDSIVGTFAGLPEGAILSNFMGLGLNATISYLGLDAATGNDIVLTVSDILPPKYDFGAATFAVDEGNVASTTLVVAVTRSQETSIPTSVDVVLTGDTAVAGSDFTAGPITVNFEIGETTRFVPIEILGDLGVEADESINLSLANFSDNGEAGAIQPTATLTITNDDFLGGLVFDDLDNDGGFDPSDGDAGIEGVEMLLVDEATNDVISTESTDASGRYVFAVTVPAGSYKIVQNVDEAADLSLLDGKETAGVNGGAVDNSQDRNEITGIEIGGSVSPNEQSVDYLFAEIGGSDLYGTTWIDFNNDGEIDFGETGVFGASVTLSGTDDRGNPVDKTMLTMADGSYAFIELRPGTYTIQQTQPITLDDGQESLGVVNDLEVPTAIGDSGYVDGNDKFSGIQLVPKSEGDRYNFGERPLPGDQIGGSSTASIGFWHNNMGQALIRSLNTGSSSTQLGDWLAATFPNMYGPGAFYDAASGDDQDMNLTDKTNAEIADIFRYLHKRNAKTAVAGGPPKVDAQVLALALATYVTSETLAGGTVAVDYGFVTSSDGIAYQQFDVLSVLSLEEATSLGLSPDGTGHVTIIEILSTIDAQSTSGLLYDSDASGSVDQFELLLRVLANDLLDAINQGSDIG